MSFSFLFQEASLSKEAPSFRSDYASFANSLIATSFTAAPNTVTTNPRVTSTTTADNDDGAVVVGKPQSPRDQWSWNSGEDDIYDKAQLEWKLR